MIDHYFQELQGLIAATSFITAVSLQTERRSDTIGFVRGDLTFEDGSRLHFREFVREEENEPPERYTYVYHYQSSEGEAIFRYDNTNHFPGLAKAPHHKHVGANDVIPADAPDLKGILREIGEHMGG
ncbi:MAG TPA: DUF6516 family protein [Anaerolineaceae bacterium]|nr:DUF6516 family protein [Anaerolineaceae bacterium]